MEILLRVEGKLDRLLADNRASPGVLYVSIKDAAKQTGLSATSIRRAVKTGELPASNAGNGDRPVWRITLADLAAWLASRRSGASKAPPRKELGELVGRYFGGDCDGSGA